MSDPGGRSRRPWWEATRHRGRLLQLLRRLNACRRARGFVSAADLATCAASLRLCEDAKLEIVGADRERSGARGTAAIAPGIAEVEARVDELLDAPSTRLAVYGTLAPGQANHWLLADVPGDWLRGSVRGELNPFGWGATEGYPAMRWDAAAEPRPVSLFRSPALPSHWARIDAFEGGEYCRVLVPVHLGAGRLTVANFYEA